MWTHDVTVFTKALRVAVAAALLASLGNARSSAVPGVLIDPSCISTNPGQAVSAKVRVGGTPDVLLAVEGLPDGAVMDPSLPVPACPVVGPLPLATCSTFKWTPTPTDIGSHEIKFKAIDGNDQSNEALLVVIVRNPPLCEIFPSGPLNAMVGVPVTFDVFATGVPGEKLHLFLSGDSSLPAGATMTPSLPILNTEFIIHSTFNWTPTAAQTGDHTITFRVGDQCQPVVFGLGGIESCTMKISVDPLSVELLYFAADVTPRGHVRLLWETASEVDNALFNVYRADPAEGTARRVNSSPIPAFGTPSQGAAYELLDNLVTLGATTPSLRYWLESVDVSGQSVVTGPITVGIRTPPSPATAKR